ncbi:MAG: hypothetical protein IKY24_01875, partial [Alistipes sp.]|nr:hypothetical protein [Alistipes sp.]
VVPFRNAKGVRNFTAPKDEFNSGIKVSEIVKTSSRSFKSVKPSVVENYTPAKVRGFAIKANAAVVR